MATLGGTVSATSEMQIFVDWSNHNPNPPTQHNNNNNDDNEIVDYHQVPSYASAPRRRATTTTSGTIGAPRPLRPSHSATNALATSIGRKAASNRASYAPPHAEIPYVDEEEQSKKSRTTNNLSTSIANFHAAANAIQKRYTFIENISGLFRCPRIFA